MGYKNIIFLFKNKNKLERYLSVEKTPPTSLTTTQEYRTHYMDLFFLTLSTSKMSFSKILMITVLTLF